MWLQPIFDLGGTFVFAFSGGATAVRHRMDIFGVLVLSFVAGNAGGVARDLLIGAVPPAAIANWPYLAVSVVAGLTAFFGSGLIGRLNSPVLWLDAVGLAFFAASGTQKALAHGLNPVVAALLGMLTGVGGGMMRDVLANEMPTVLRADVYASAALAGGAVIAAGHVLRLPPLASSIAGATLCFALRFMTIRYDWHLPRSVRGPSARGSGRQKERRNPR
jgi:uncharacterized membrane protein YeiH